MRATYVAGLAAFAAALVGAPAFAAPPAPPMPAATSASPAKAPAAPVTTAAPRPAETPAPGFTNLKTFPAPDARGTGTVAFQTQAIRLNGNAPATGGQPQQITLDVPSSLQGSRLAHIELMHSQSLAEKTQPWTGKKTDRDLTAPYSQVEVYVEGRGWTDLGQRKKFAEARTEVERLHDLPDARGRISAVRVRNVGVDPVHVEGVTLHFLPPKPKAFDEMAFMPSISFGDAWSDIAPSTARVRDVEVQGTRYPGSITLNNTGEWAPTPQPTLDKVKARGWTLEKDSLVIPLEAGKRIRTAELAMGDTHPDHNLNGDGSYGRKGWARLHVTIERPDGTRVPLTSNENVPSEGLLVATADHHVEPGDRLRIQVTGDAAGLMGVRIGYDDTPAAKAP